MIASRYGAIPVVRETGGLYDSIKPYWMEKRTMHGNGFTFADYSAEVLRRVTENAIELYRDPVLSKKLIAKIMKTDFSWSASALQYVALYDGILG